MLTGLSEGASKRLGDYFAGQPVVAAAFVFGSTVRGDDRPASDVDVAVLLDHGHAEDVLIRARLTSELMGVLGRSDVDVTILNSAPPLLLHRVLRDGHVVFARSNAVIADFTIQAFQQYVDTRPLRELQTERLARLLRRGREDRECRP